MFIHLGGDTLINSESIIAIISNENALNDGCNKEFFKKNQEQRDIKRVDLENCKSIVITDKAVYLSPISSLTLKKRAEFLSELNRKS